MTVAAALAEGKAILAAGLAENGGGTPALDAEILLAEVLGISRSRLPVIDREEIAAEKLARYRQFAGRRGGGEPVAYITGKKEFYGLEFMVSPAVLIPRPDTETLVECALEHIRRLISSARGGGGPIAVLDLCTGSGAVAVSLKHEIPEIAVYASDISGAALDIARENSKNIPEKKNSGVSPPDNENRNMTFIQSDLFSAIPRSPRFDVIVSNPPYIPRSDLAGLQREVRREPEIALDGGADGLEIIRRIIAESPEWLLPGGALFIEADPAQMAEIAAIFTKNGFSGLKFYRDLAGKERVAGAAVVPAPEKMP